jgi:hypothetical protein
MRDLAIGLQYGVLCCFDGLLAEGTGKVLFVSEARWTGHKPPSTEKGASML